MGNQQPGHAGNLESRSIAAQFLQHVDDKWVIALNTAARQPTRIRVQDFKLYHPNLDPTQLFPNVFRLFQVPMPLTNIVSDTPAPTSTAHAPRYADTQAWQEAYGPEINQLQSKQQIEWTNNIAKAWSIDHYLQI